MPNVYSRAKGIEDAFENRDCWGTRLAINLAKAIEEANPKLFGPKPN